MECKTVGQLASPARLAAESMLDPKLLLCAAVKKYSLSAVIEQMLYIMQPPLPKKL